MTDSEEFDGRTRERRSADEFGGRSSTDTLHLRRQLDRWIDEWIAEGMHRPKRLKMAKPAALAMAEASLIPLE